ncbi:SGNH/GDSL hydrolase family protein [Verrucomicrobiales bacterium]|nr:SGNH/GDSL hydrolase family protein [Verrucomicrobiales bacterium]MDB4662279.1 SGNH/GDSL hydrolase family protein [Verrucomicrobiales bacterium]
MKIFLLAAGLLSLSLVTAPSICAQSPVLEKGDRIAIVGDSITEQKLYSKFIETYLLACTPQWDLQVFQFGWGGERAPGFAARQENDLAFWKPDVITTCFGMNDGSYQSYKPEIGERYETGMRAILDRFKKDGVAFVVGGPGVVDSATFAKDKPEFDIVYNENLKQLDAIAKKLADENGFVHAEVFDTMMTVMTKAKAEMGELHPVAGRDGVHPGANGHLAMAFAFLKALGVSGEIANISLDMKTGKATVSDGHQVLEKAADSVTIESSRYPFCFYGGENDANGTVSVNRFLPFNDELNRFMFSVKNVSSAKAEVQWGEAKKTFTREELKAGINLAAEFMDGPFQQPFAETMKAVAVKQGFETSMIKDQISKFRMYQAYLPDDPEVVAATKVLTKKLQEKDDELFQAANASVRPVTHTITVRAVE